MPRPKGSKNKPKGEKTAKPAKGAKGERKKFQAPVNTKTGAVGAETQAPGGKPANEAPVQGSEVRRMTPGATLKSLLKECRGLKQNMDELNGSMREKIAYAKDKKNLNTAVFGLLRKFDKMEAEKAAEFLDTLLYYLDVSGIQAKIDAVSRLPLGDSPDGGSVDFRGEGAGEEAAADEADGEAAEAAQHANGGEAHANGADAGEVQPSAEEPVNVTRPRFGQRAEAPQSQSAKADEIARAAGTKH